MRQRITSISDPGFSVPQFKLQVNVAGDQYEQEADRIANAVMHNAGYRGAATVRSRHGGVRVSKMSKAGKRGSSGK